MLLVSSVDGLDPVAGTAFVAGDRTSVQFVPAPGFVGSANFEYTIDDGRGGEASSEVVVAVVPLDTNLPPVANVDIAAVRAGTSARVNVLVNDVDPEGDPLVLLDVRSEQGNVSFTADGQVVFFPVVDSAAARIEIEYTIADTFGATAEGILRVAVRPAESNNEPDARNDAGVGVVGLPVTINVLDNDYDADGDLLTVISGGAIDAKGQDTTDQRFRITTDGEASFTSDDAGIFRFVYVVSDGSESDTAQIRIVVGPADTNRPPIAARDDVAIVRGGVGVAYPLENDSDPDGDIISIVDWSSPDGVDVELLDLSSFRISPTLKASPTSTVQYAISDGSNDPVWSSVIVTAADSATSNQPPSPLDDYTEVRPGEPTIVHVLENDTDPDGDPLTVKAVSSTPHADVTPVANAVRIVAPSDARGGFAFTYDVIDTEGNQSSASVTVRVVQPTEPNRAPIARADTSRSAAGVPVTLDVLANDSDPDGDPIVVVATSQPSHGSVTQLDYRSLLYIPDPGFAGTDDFEYVIQDVNGDQARGNVLVGITPMQPDNRPPTANDDRVVVVEGDDNIVIPVLLNDSDPDGDRLIIARTTQPREGSVAVGSEGTVLVFSPASDAAAGTETSFVYDIQDRRGGSSSATVSVLIGEAGQPIAPVAVDDLVGPAGPGDILEVAVLANDLDPDGNAAALTVTSDDPGVEVLPSRSIRLTAPDATTRFWYTVTDRDGLASRGVITVFVVTNEPPKVTTDSVQTLMNESIDIDLTSAASDADGDELLFICCDNIRNGFAEVLSDTETELRVRFTPSTDFFGIGGFAFRVDDRQGHVVSATQQIEIVPPDNIPPTVVEARVEVEAGRSTNIDLTTFGRDEDGGSISLVSVGRSTNAAVSAERDGNSVLVSSDFGAAAQMSSIPFTISDGEDEASGELVVAVVPTSVEPPIAVPDVEGNRIYQGESIEIDVLANDVDPEGEGLQIVAAGVTSAGSTAIIGDGAAVGFTPRGDFFGTATFTYTIQDVHMEADRESSAQVEVSVIGRPGIPQQPSVMGGNAQVVLTWLSPEGNGSPIDGYEVRSSTGDVRDVGLTNGYTWTSLTNGQPVTFEVRAHNEAGWSEWSQTSADVTPDTLPEVPSAPSLTFGDEQISIQWTQPFNEGSPITSYLIQSSDGVRIDVGNLTDYTWTGLNNGTAYTFQIAAVNAAGATVFGPASAPETPARAPDGPGPPAGTRGSTVVDLTWNEPNLNGAPILEYEVRINPGGTTTSVGTGTSYSWASLPNGVAVTFDVRGRNKAGWSDWSPQSSPVTPCGVPDPVSGIGALRGDRLATVTWQSPGAQGCRVQQYEILSSAGGSQFVGGEADVSSVGVARSHGFTGLANGTAYTFRVRAENEVGWGPFSAESAPVTPAGPPLAPSISAQSTNPGQVTLSWSAPGDNGSPITGYQVSVNGGPPSQVSGPPFSPHIIGGLSNSTAYSFRVRAVNDVGAGAWSGARSVTTWGPPSAVSTPSTSAGNGQVAVSWNAPASNGSPIIEYEVDISPGASATTAARNRTFTGLSNGTTYTFRVRARNAVGWGPWGGSRSATPSAPKTATVSRGAFENVPGCSGPSCYHLRLTASGIPQGSFTARCFNDTGWWHEQSITIGSAGTYNADLNCIYGFPGNDVWVEIVGQIITPRYRWPN